MKKFLRAKNIVTSLLVAYVYSTFIVDGCSNIGKALAIITMFFCILIALNNIDVAYIKECRKKKEAKVKEDVQN